MQTRVGLIGTGYIAVEHIKALKRIPGVVVAAVAGRNIAKATELAAMAGGKAYEDYHEMLRKENLDAAFILMPPDIHGDIEKACAQYVPAVLIEKPIGVDLQKTLEIERMFKDAGTIAVSGYMMRYFDSVERARQLFAGSDNKPALISGWWVNQMPGPAWWRDMQRSGGQFVEQCTHLVDAARYIAGEITAVSAYAARGFVNGVEGYSVDDAMTVNVQFASGAVGSFTTGCFPMGLKGNVGMTVGSRDISCSFSGWGMELELESNDGHTEHIDGADHDIFIVQNAAFLEAAAAKDAALFRSSYSSGIQTLKVTLAANESCRSGGKTIYLS